ncbi:hypothetical protein Tco_1178268 [Tanacetum coccineum]
MDSGLVVLSFLPSGDPIVSLNKAMTFISTAFTSRYPLTNNQLRTLADPRNQATIQDGRVQVQTVQGIQNQGYAGSGAGSNATATRVNKTGETNTVGQAKVIHCYNRQEEDHMARQCTKPKRPRNSTWFKEKVMLTEALELGVVLDEEQMAFLADMGIYDVLMAKLSSYDLTTLLEAKEDKYLDEIIELEKQKKALDNVIYKMGQSTQTMHIFSKPQAFYDETHKIALGYQNPLYLSQAQRKVPALYCGYTIVKHVALSVIDTEETLELAEESLHKEITDMKEVFTQMETEAAKCSVERKTFEIKEKELLLENDHLLELVISQDLVHTTVNTLAAIADYKHMEKSYLDEYKENLEL